MNTRLKQTRQFSHFSTQINPVTTNPSYNEQKMAGPELFIINEFENMSFSKPIHHKISLNFITLNFLKAGS
jgi:hypothetical protein